MVNRRTEKSKHRRPSQQRQRAQPAHPAEGATVDTAELHDLVTKLQGGVCDNVIYFFDERIYIVVTRENVAPLTRFLDGEGEQLELPFSVLPDFPGEGATR